MKELSEIKVIILRANYNVMELNVRLQQVLWVKVENCIRRDKGGEYNISSNCPQ